MTKYIPEVGTITIPETVKEKTVSGVLNPLPGGTRIRATLGQTIIVGTISRESHPYGLVSVDIEPGVDDDILTHLLSGFNLWLASGWEFEILDDAEAVPA